MAARPRAPRIWLALCGLVAGAAVTLTGIVLTAGSGAARRSTTSLSSARVPVSPRILSPAGLDRQWVTYSDTSTCADLSGGDSASAVRLSRTQIAWFFSDSFLGPAGPRTGFSRLSGFVHNLVVVQTISGQRSRLVTITGGHACSGPGKQGRALSVVSPVNAGGIPGERYGDGDGIRTGSRIVRFYTRYLPGRVPYVPVATVIASFPVNQLRRAGRGPGYGEVIRPTITPVPSDSLPGSPPIVWGTSVLRDKRYVYIYGWRGPDSQLRARSAYLARVAVSGITDVAAWRYYAGGGRWSANQASTQPVTSGGKLNPDAGFSVLRLSGRYWLIEHGRGLGSADIAAYPAARPWGSFGTLPPLWLYHAPGIGVSAADNYQVMYSVQAEPALSDRNRLVISYSVNSLAVDAGCVPVSMFTNSIIQPRFIAVPRAVFAAAARGRYEHVRAVAGPDRYPAIVSAQPGLWYDAWTYRHGCPPVPAVRFALVRRSGSSVHVRWPSAGIDVRYRVELTATGTTAGLQRTVLATNITFRHLTPGRTYLVRVIPENKYHRAGPGASATFTGLHTLGEHMRFAIAIPQFYDDGEFDPASFRAYFSRAEELGYDSAWALEGILGQGPQLGPVEAMTYAAACTSRMRLGCAVFVSTLYSPVHLAKSLSTLDQLSGGRLDIGVGTGGKFRPFAAFGAEADRYVARFTEGLALMKALWTEHQVTFDGQFWQLRDAVMEPKPAQKPHPPLWFGGSGPAALRRAARLGDGFFGAGSTSTAAFADQVSAVRAELSEAASFQFAKRVYIAVDENADRARHRMNAALERLYGGRRIPEFEAAAIAGSTGDCVRELSAVAEAGADLICLTSLFDQAEHAERLAADVLPQLEADAPAANRVLPGSYPALTARRDR